jgi:hypothetical protein
MSRWWENRASATSVLSLVDGTDLPTEVGIAVLGLHGLGADVLSQGVPDDESLGQAFEAIDTEPVQKAWETSFAGVVDDPQVYARGRVSDVKSDADAGARLVVKSLTAQGVAWPLAVERAAQAYGLPPKDAASFVRKVAKPAVPPAVLRHEADQSLSAFAARLGELERDVSDEEIGKASAQQDYYGDEPGERDSQGRFARKGGGAAGKQKYFEQRQEAKRKAAQGKRRRGKQAAADESKEPGWLQRQVTSRQRDKKKESSALEDAAAAMQGDVVAAEQSKAAKETMRRKIMQRALQRRVNAREDARVDAEIAAEVAAEQAAQAEKWKADDAKREKFSEELEQAPAPRRRRAATESVGAKWDVQATVWDDRDAVSERLKHIKQDVVLLPQDENRFVALPKMIHNAIVREQGLRQKPYQAEASAELIAEKIEEHYAPEVAGLFAAHTSKSLGQALTEGIKAGLVMTGDRPDEFMVKDEDGDWDTVSFVQVRGAKVAFDETHVIGRPGSSDVPLDAHRPMPLAADVMLTLRSSDAADVQVSDDETGEKAQVRGSFYPGMPEDEVLAESLTASRASVDLVESYAPGLRDHTDAPGVTIVRKAAQEYYGDDPDERDERGRFAAKGSAGPKAEYYAQRQEAKRQGARRRKRRGSGRVVPITPAQPKPASNALEVAAARMKQAQPEKQSSVGQETMKRRIMQRALERQVQQLAQVRGQAHRSSSSSKAKREGGKRSKSTNLSAEEFADALTAASSVSLVDVSNPVFTRAAGGQQPDDLGHFLQMRGDEVLRNEAQGQFGVGDDVMTATKGALGRARQWSKGLGVAEAMPSSEAVEAIRGVLIAAKRPRIRIDQSEVAEAKAAGVKIQSAVNDNGDVEYFRGKTAGDAPTTLVLGNAKGGASVLERVAEGASIVHDVTMSSHDAADLLVGALKATGKDDAAEEAQMLADSMKNHPAVPIEIMVVK